MLLILKENTMRNLSLVLLVIGSIFIFFGCQEDSALTPLSSQSDQDVNSLAKPAPTLTGIAITSFNLDDPPYFWRGTVDFGDETIYGLVFNSHGFPTVRGKSSHFEEEFIIFQFGTDYTDPNNYYLKGSNAGIVANENKPPDPVKFLSNGTVEIANYPFEGWLGRSVHIRGVVNWLPNGDPEEAVGTLRIN
jgi:hypothetical protein